MPRKSVPKTSKKTSVTKSKAETKKTSTFRAQQEEFHTKNPNAKGLISLFIVAFCISIVVYFISGSLMY